MHVLRRDNWLQYYFLLCCAMSCGKRKGKFSHSKRYGHKVQTFVRLVYRTKIWKLSVSKKTLVTAEEQRKRFNARIETDQKDNAGIHASSSRCKYHLNSCSGPKQLAKLNSQ
ncbi:TPA: hypothetical protein ACH3X2_013441 [Trebouxia sp. C0005]